MITGWPAFAVDALVIWAVWILVKGY